MRVLTSAVRELNQGAPPRRLLGCRTLGPPSRLLTGASPLDLTPSSTFLLFLASNLTRGHPTRPRRPALREMTAPMQGGISWCADSWATFAIVEPSSTDHPPQNKPKCIAQAWLHPERGYRMRPCRLSGTEHITDRSRREHNLTKNTTRWYAQVHVRDIRKNCKYEL